MPQKTRAQGGGGGTGRPRLGRPESHSSRHSGLPLHPRRSLCPCPGLCVSFDQCWTCDPFVPRCSRTTSSSRRSCQSSRLPARHASPHHPSQPDREFHGCRGAPPRVLPSLWPLVPPRLPHPVAPPVPFPGDPAHLPDVPGQDRAAGALALPLPLDPSRACWRRRQRRRVRRPRACAARGGGGR